MRIIAGTLRRRQLTAPKGTRTRPSTDRVREALFGLITHRVTLDDAVVLDLFAGTGALGLEAISRGARRTVFVEIHARVLAAARQNALRLGVADQCLFLRQDAIKHLERPGSHAYDVVFADPPYTLESMERLPALALPCIAPRGLFVLEHDKRVSFSNHTNLRCSRAYGRTIVSIFAHHSF